MTLPTDYNARKDFPLLTFLTAYMPDAIEALVELSRAGNVQHKIETPADQPFFLTGDRIAWDRAKSAEEMETLMRHAWEHMRAKRGAPGFSMIDTDHVLHIIKTAWRACAEAQKTIEFLRAKRFNLDLEEIGPGRFRPVEHQDEIPPLGKPLSSVDGAIGRAHGCEMPTRTSPHKLDDVVAACGATGSSIQAGRLLSSLGGCPGCGSPPGEPHNWPGCTGVGI